MHRRLVPLAQHSVKQFRRDSVVARDGPAGRIRDVYFDDRDWRVRYLVLQTGGWLGSRVLIPPASVDVQGSGEGVLRVELTRAEARQAPGADSARPVFRQIQLAQAVRLGYPYYWSGLGLWGAAGGRSQADAERAAHAELARGDPHLRSAAALLGCRAEARDAPLGRVADFVVDERTWSISSVIVDTRRWRPGGRVRIAPALVERIDWSARVLRLLPRVSGRRSG